MHASAPADCGASVVTLLNCMASFCRKLTLNLVVGGATFSWTHHAAIETNWTYQHDTRSSVTNLNALNVILHLFFETKAARLPS